MHLPTQCQPVQRTITGRPSAVRGNGDACMNAWATGDQGVRPSDYGVQPSFDWTSLIPIATGILSMF
jgi:hypothetical protein